MKTLNYLIFFIYTLIFLTICPANDEKAENETKILETTNLPPELQNIISGYTVGWHKDKTIELPKINAKNRFEKLNHIIHHGDVFAISPDNKYIATFYEEMEYGKKPLYALDIWNINTGNIEKEIKVSREEDIPEITSIIYSPTRPFIFTSHGGDIKLGRTFVWDIENEKLNNFDMKSADADSNKKFLISDVAIPKIGGSIFAILNVGGKWRNDRLINATTAEFLAIPKQSLSLSNLIISPDNKLLAAINERDKYLPEAAGHKITYPEGQSTIYIWDIDTKSITQTISDHADFIAFSPDNKILASLSSKSSKESFIKLWDVQNGTLLNKFNLDPKSYYESLSFSPNGKFLATNNRESAKIFDLKGNLAFDYNYNFRGWLLGLKYLQFLVDNSLAVLTPSTIDIWKYEGID